MTSERQLRANRLNATKSTGPRTAAGKATSASNALTHGLTAARILIPGESADAFAALSRALHDELAPQGALEELLVERITGMLWRLRRVPQFEAGLMAWVGQQQRSRLGPDRIKLGAVVISCASELASDTSSGDELAALWGSRRLGRLAHALLSNDRVLVNLGRYERDLARQLERDLAALRRERLHAFPRLHMPS
jgi:hypothetical protein